MKIKFFFVTLACFVAVSFAAFVCKNGTECKFDECCLKPLFSNKTLCRPKIKAKQLCLFKPNYFNHKTGIYELSCPCEPGYKCVLDEEEFEAITSYRLSSKICEGKKAMM
ncbi:hypothetical protein NPIL_666261 [Nephila pilipes]|uniref:Uncharacterized protein n=1 Tax=Nephila pilipes TaxID=299642 RepID=A0A8X6TZ94_NEPPI|nr:hypothetical protein NPIL_666261 [Nephila pilipes]